MQTTAQIPQSTAQLPKPDKLWYFGLFLLAASLTLFCLPGMNTEFLSTIFFANYTLLLLYTGVLLFGSRYFRRGGNGLAHIFLCLILALISCYSLNRGAPLFESAVPWWSAVLIICCVNYGTFFFFPRLPKLMQLLIGFIAGVSLVTFLYLACYLAPTYFIGALATPALGISLHVFIPLLFFIFTIVFVVRNTRTWRHLKYSAGAGVLFALVFTAQYAVRWNSRVRAINSDITAAKATTSDLPDWVTVAQHCRPTSLDNAVLSTGIFYTSGEKLYAESSGIFWMPRTRRNNIVQHDPLVVIASLFSGTPKLDEPEQLNILRSVFSARHETQRRNWQGGDLITSDVATDVQLWPEQHVSYTEETITIANTGTPERWAPLTEEAMYTFHLPEGAVISALSLWIAGKEEKGILTTRQKADSAYQTIVGHYRRDPSVVHWQEGNTVTVKVFPVTPDQPRRFKLGVTAPLELDGSKLLYHSIGFEGPSAAGATASVRVLPMQALVEPEWPAGFQSDSTGHLHYLPSLLSVTAATHAPIRQSGSYVSQWVLQCKDPGIHPATFAFNGTAYTTVAHTSTMEPAAFRQYYFDLNSSWSADEYEGLLSSLGTAPVYATLTGDDLVRVTAENKKAIFEAGARRQFSIFPVYRITDLSTSLLVSKSTPWSPNFSDLHGTAFAGHLQTWLEHGGHLRLYDIGGNLSPYLKALKEAGVFQYQKGDVYTLQSQLHHQRFPADILGANEVLIEPAGLVIRSDSGSVDPTAVAPGSTDHLLRLFAYRRILQQLKSRLPGEFPDSALSRDLPIQLAQEAGIVSPVSSYVVLEKKADYDAFTIQESPNSLHDASIKGNGAVPEPGEWAILAGLLGFFLVVKYYRLRKQLPINQ